MALFKNSKTDMKKLSLMFSAAFVLLLCSFVTKVQTTPDTYQFNAEKSMITWTSTAEDGTTHKGKLDFKSGNFKFDVKTLLSGFSYINMQTLTCTDITDEGFNRELITEMRSAEQLNHLKYKEANFKVVKAKRLDVAAGQPNYDIDGIFKIKGIDVPVKFTATIEMVKKGVVFSGSFVLPKDKTQLPYDMAIDLLINADLVK